MRISEVIGARARAYDVDVAWRVSLFIKADTNADQTITCQEQESQGEHYIDVSSSDDEQMESLVCATKKQGLYIDVIISRDFYYQLEDTRGIYLRDAINARILI